MANCTNLNLSIVDQNFDCVSKGHRIVHGIIMAVILLANLTLNCTVLALVYKYKKLRQKSVLVTLGLVLADMLSGVVWVFQAEASTITGEWPFSDTGCSIFAYFYLTLLYVRWCEVLAFTNDRFCQILFPFWHQRWANWLIIVSTMLAWGVPAVVSLPTTILGLTSFYLTFTACSVNCGTNEGCSQGITALFGFHIVIGSVIPTLMYIFVYLYGWRKKIAMKRRLKMGTGEGIPKSGSNEQNFMQIFNRERQALTTCLLVFITNIATTMLIYATSALRSRDEIYQHIPLEVHYLAMYLFLLGTVLDPLVIMRTRDFREKLSICCRRNVKIQGSVSQALRNVIDLGLSGEGSTKITNLSNGVTMTDINSSGTIDDNSHTEC